MLHVSISLHGSTNTLMCLQKHVGSFQSLEEAIQARMYVAIRTGHHDASLLFDTNPYDGCFLSVFNKSDQVGIAIASCDNVIQRL